MTDNELDDIDHEILQLLSQDGRMKLKEIGEKIADVNNGIPLSHVAIRNRINKLLPQHIKIQANMNLNRVAQSSVYILIETKDYDTQRKMIEQARLCPRIISLETISGKFNIILRVLGHSLQDIDCFVSNVIQSDDMIRNYQILHCNAQIKPKYIPIPLMKTDFSQQLRTPCGQNCGFCSMYKDQVCSGCPGSFFSKTTYQNLLDTKK